MASRAVDAWPINRLIVQIITKFPTPEIGIPPSTTPQGGTPKYTLTFAYDSPR